MEQTTLTHWGIKGMKWGRRRYQNPDGSLTPAGKKRYGEGGGDSAKSAEPKRKSVRDMSDDELNKAITRARMEDTYNQLRPEPVSRKQYIADKIIKDVVEPAVTNAGKKFAENMVNKLVDKVAGKAGVEKSELDKLKDEFNILDYKKKIDDLKNPKRSFDDMKKEQEYKEAKRKNDEAEKRADIADLDRQRDYDKAKKQADEAFNDYQDYLKKREAKSNTSSTSSSKSDDDISDYASWKDVSDDYRNSGSDFIAGLLEPPKK